MNLHMDLKHGVKNFNQLLKRSFQPEAEPDSSENSSNKKPKKTKAGPKKPKKKEIKDEGEINMSKMILDNDGVHPLNSDLNNNETKPTKTTLKVKGGPKKPDSSENSSNKMPKKAKTGPKKSKKQEIKDEGEINIPKMTSNNDDADPLELNNNETKPAKGGLKMNIKQEIKEEGEINN